MTNTAYTGTADTAAALDYLTDLTLALRSAADGDAKSLAQILLDAGIDGSNQTLLLDAAGASRLSLEDIARVAKGLTGNTPLSALVRPTADAGPDQTVASAAAGVTLDASGSTFVGTATYAWTQVSGTAVTLTGDTTASPTFTAPTGPDTLVFSLVITDNNLNSGTPLASRADTVTVNVSAP